MIEGFSTDVAYEVDGYKGVAWRIERPDVEYRLGADWYSCQGHEPATEEEYNSPIGTTFFCDGSCNGDPEFPDDFEAIPTGLLVMYMVGDDREFIIDPASVTEIDDEDFCGQCGQIGCGHG